MAINKKNNEDFNNLDFDKISFEIGSNWIYKKGGYGMDDNQWNLIYMHFDENDNIDIYPFPSFMNIILNNIKDIKW